MTYIFTDKRLGKITSNSKENLKKFYFTCQEYPCKNLSFGKVYINDSFINLYSKEVEPTLLEEKNAFIDELNNAKKEIQAYLPDYTIEIFDWWGRRQEKTIILKELNA